ncbi:hypothetical protein K2Z84_33830 [Candidatus Binatia bacterium]|nr:hypothetical protein [Candidatus Binatia bacterium]
MARETSDDPGATRFTVRAYPLAMRLGAGWLLAASGLALPFLLVRVLIADDPPMTPPMVLRSFIALSALPALAALAIQRALRGELVLDASRVVVNVGGQRFEVALAEVVGIEPWRIPLPMPGFRLRLASGKRFPLGIGADDPTPILDALVLRGVAAGASVTMRPAVVYARVKHALGRMGWRRMLVKYPLFGLAVTAAPFNAHQHIAYGGLLGQYYLEGAWPWARTFLLYWSTITIYLVLYASVWRWPAEVIAWLAAFRGEPRARQTRVVLEWICRVVYYAGVLALLALRFSD